MKIGKYIDDKGKPGWFTPGLDGTRIVCKYDKKTGKMEKTSTVIPAPKPSDKLTQHYKLRISAAVAKGDMDRAGALGNELAAKLAEMKKKEQEALVKA